MITFLNAMALALALTAAFVLLRKHVHKRSWLVYSAFALLSIIIVGAGMHGVAIDWPAWFRTYFSRPLTQGALSVAVFVIVMYVGVLPKKWRITRALRYVRAELSVVGCIFSLAHNAQYANLFVDLFTNPMGMRGNGLYAIASIDSLILIALMIPLLITSFYSVRKLFSAKRWKSLQKWSYAFYAGLYVHVVVIFYVAMSGGHHAASAAESLWAYSLFFIPYFALRPLKYWLDRRAGQKETAEEDMI